MKNFLRVSLILGLLYVLGAAAFALRHYPAQRPGVGQMVTDFNEALTGVFRESAPEKSPPRIVESDGALDDLRAGFATELSRIPIPDTGSLSAAAARNWDALRLLRDDVLPKAHSALADLARLKVSDPAAFTKQRDALRATLNGARGVLEPLTTSKMPVPQAERLLEALEKIEASLSGL